MLSLRTAAALLAAADSPQAIATLLASIGIAGVARPLDARQLKALGVGETLRDAHFIASGETLRAVAAIVRDGPPLREQLPRLAARLQSRAPHVRWLLALADPRDATLALAAWNDERHPPRVRSLVVDRNAVRDADAETLCALHAAACRDATLLHLRWTEVLGRDALSRRFYRELERRVHELAESTPARVSAEDRRALALLHTSRLLFLAFLEAKGWLDGRRDFLVEAFDARMAAGGGFQPRVLRPLFFGTLNTPIPRRASAAHALGRIPFLNGGLFAATALERRHRDVVFSDEAYGALVGDLFTHYRFTAREETASFSDAAVDPEMLGRAFESLMASHDRRESGAFFTPQHLVERVTDLALAETLRGPGLDDAAAHALVRGAAPPDVDHDELRRRLARLTVLDPACGSGAFLVHALQRLAGLRATLGDRRAPSDVRRDVLTGSLFGVDRNPMAVWLCELRLWLSVVIESEVDDPCAVAPLPNLDRNVRVGDALSGAGFRATALDAGARSRRLATLRGRYARATGARKATLGRALDREERARALDELDRTLAGVQHARRERLLARRGPDLFGQRGRLSADDRETLAALRDRLARLRRERRRIADGGALPFSFAVHFADVADRGGFDVVVGNPPWIRAHRLPPAERAWLRREYEVFRHAQWEPGAAAARASAGFAGQVDASALFIERSRALLARHGVLALLVPAKLWRSLAGGGVRRFLQTHTELLHVQDLSDAPALFDAAVYPSVLVSRAAAAGGDPAGRPVRVAVQRGTTMAEWDAPAPALALDDTPGSPWLLLPPAVRAAFDRFTQAGVPLASSPVGRPLLGVKTGCNEALVVELLDVHGDVATVRSNGGMTGAVESARLRPLVRGETVDAWEVRPNRERILWPCDAASVPLHELPPCTRRWLAQYRPQLSARSDARSTRQWWSLFRTEGARFDRPRVVWADFGRRPRALVLRAGDRTVPLNTCYVIRCADDGDAFALAALLNSPLAAAWLNVVAEPARGGFRRFMGWAVARLPVPADWSVARRELPPVVARFARENRRAAAPSAALLDALLPVFGLRLRDVEPLLEWTAP